MMIPLLIERTNLCPECGYKENFVGFNKNKIQIELKGGE